ncbi:hypothetical protein [Vulcanisaeta sp. JCM 14467]|uniref:hypothetical protein n=1 Tax=Vulcanisaeta sp. JCM 14467 TaxID=1295370 RepID=UPI0020937303|nr:hypothetical protein [Vulcanisaeta sp. JCM 14467]
MRVRGLNVGRRRDPGGNYVVTMDLETYELLKQLINRLGLSVETVGNVVIVRDKSWSRIRRLVNSARELGISVYED